MVDAKKCATHSLLAVILSHWKKVLSYFELTTAIVSCLLPSFFCNKFTIFSGDFALRSFP